MTLLLTVQALPPQHLAQSESASLPGADLGALGGTPTGPGRPAGAGQPAGPHSQAAGPVSRRSEQGAGQPPGDRGPGRPSVPGSSEQQLPEALAVAEGVRMFFGAVDFQPLNAGFDDGSWLWRTSRPEPALFRLNGPGAAPGRRRRCQAGRRLCTCSSGRMRLQDACVRAGGHGMAEVLILQREADGGHVSGGQPGADRAARRSTGAPACRPPWMQQLPCQVDAAVAHPLLVGAGDRLVGAGGSGGASPFGRAFLAVAGGPLCLPGVPRAAPLTGRAGPQGLPVRRCRRSTGARRSRCTWTARWST